jgi:hypothetical protein
MGQTHDDSSSPGYVKFINRIKRGKPDESRQQGIWRLWLQIIRNCT